MKFVTSTLLVGAGFSTLAAAQYHRFAYDGYQGAVYPYQHPYGIADGTFPGYPFPGGYLLPPPPGPAGPIPPEQPPIYPYGYSYPYDYPYGSPYGYPQPPQEPPQSLPPSSHYTMSTGVHTASNYTEYSTRVSWIYSHSTALSEPTVASFRPIDSLEIPLPSPWYTGSTISSPAWPTTTSMARHT